MRNALDTILEALLKAYIMAPFMLIWQPQAQHCLHLFCELSALIFSWRTVVISSVFSLTGNGQKHNEHMILIWKLTVNTMRKKTPQLYLPVPCSAALPGPPGLVFASAALKPAASAPVSPADWIKWENRTFIVFSLVLKCELWKEEKRKRTAFSLLSLDTSWRMFSLTLLFSWNSFCSSLFSFWRWSTLSFRPSTWVS